MKKLNMLVAILLPLCLACGVDLSNFNFDAAIKFQTKSINRGRMEMGKSLDNRIEIGMRPIEQLRTYIGGKTVFGMKTMETVFFTSIAPYIGFSYDFSDEIVIDAGYSHGIYVHSPRGEGISFRDGAREFYAGAVYDALYSPALYLFYNFDCNEITAEFTLLRTANFSSFGFRELSCEFMVKIGYDMAVNPYGIKDIFKDSKKDYFYGGLSVTLIRPINRNANVRLGVSYACNFANKSDWPNNPP